MKSVSKLALFVIVVPTCLGLVLLQTWNHRTDFDIGALESELQVALQSCTSTARTVLRWPKVQKYVPKDPGSIHEHFNTPATEPMELSRKSSSVYREASLDRVRRLEKDLKHISALRGIGFEMFNEGAGLSH